MANLNEDELEFSTFSSVLVQGANREDPTLVGSPIDWPLMSAKEPLKLSDTPTKTLLRAMDESIDSTTKELFLRIMDGKFLMKWKETIPRDSIVFYVHDDRQPDEGPVITVRSQSLKYMQNANASTPGASLEYFDYNVGGALGNLSLGAQRLVLYRSIHVFLRAKSTLLLLGHCQALVIEVAQYYADQERWVELYDIRALNARLLLFHDVDTNTCYDHFTLAAEALEMKGLFVDAGSLYYQCSTKDFLGPKRIFLLKDAGSAFKSAALYQQSEASFVELLHATYARRANDPMITVPLGRTNVVNGELEVKFLMNMICMYQEWKSVDAGGSSRFRFGQESTEAETTYVPLLALLSLVGFGNDEMEMEYNESVNGSLRDMFDAIAEVGRKLAAGILKANFRKMRKAKAVLAQAVGTGSVHDFRAALHSAVMPNACVDIEHPFQADFGNSKQRRQRAKEVRRNDPRLFVFDVMICANCQTEKPRTELMQCPCHKVFYCNKQCQMVHWKSHKQTCPLGSRAKLSKK